MIAVAHASIHSKAMPVVEVKKAGKTANFQRELILIFFIGKFNMSANEHHCSESNSSSCQRSVRNHQMRFKGSRVMKKENVIRDKSLEFAIRMMKTYQHLTAGKKNHSFKTITKEWHVDWGICFWGERRSFNAGLFKQDINRMRKISWNEALNIPPVEDRIHWARGDNRLFNDADEIGRILFPILKSTSIKSVNYDQRAITNHHQTSPRF